MNLPTYPTIAADVLATLDSQLVVDTVTRHLENRSRQINDTREKCIRQEMAQGWLARLLRKPPITREQAENNLRAIGNRYFQPVLPNSLLTHDLEVLKRRAESCAAQGGPVKVEAYQAFVMGVPEKMFRQGIPVLADAV